MRKAAPPSCTCSGHLRDPPLYGPGFFYLGNNLSRTDTFIFLISVIFVKSLPIDRECFNAIKQ